MKIGNLSIIITELGLRSILVRHPTTLIKNHLTKKKKKRMTSSVMIGRQQTTRMEKSPSLNLRPRFMAILTMMMMTSNKMLMRNNKMLTNKKLIKTPMMDNRLSKQKNI